MSNKKNAKKARQVVRALKKRLLKGEAELKEITEQQEEMRRSILFDSSKKLPVRCQLLWPNAVPELIDDDASDKVKNIRKTAVWLFAHILIQLGQLSDKSGWCARKEFDAFKKLYFNDLGQLDFIKTECDDIVLNYRDDDKWRNRFGDYCLFCSASIAKMNRFDKSRDAGDFNEDENENVEMNGNENKTERTEINVGIGYSI